MRFLSSLLVFNYVRFVWAVRSFLASVIILLISYFFVDSALWLLCSAMMALQMYMQGERFAKKFNLFILTCWVAFIGATLAMFSHHTWVLWITTMLLISLTFYFSHQGVDRASVGLWSAIIIIINIFFPISSAQWFERIFFLLLGMFIAYGALLIKVPMRKKDQIASQLQHFLRVFRKYTSHAFHNVLFESSSLSSDLPQQAEDALTQLHRLIEILPMTYNAHSPEFKQLLIRYYESYRRLFFWLAAFEYTPRLSKEIKLSLEHLQITLQFLLNIDFDLQKLVATIDSMHYQMNKMDRYFSEIGLDTQQNKIFYLLKKIVNELEALAFFLNTAPAQKALVYLKQVKTS